MHPSTRVMLRASLVPAMCIALAACATGAPAAATVSGSDITNDQLATAASVFRAVAGLQQQPCGQTEGDTDTEEAACNRFSLGALIEFREADLYAQQHGITVSDDKVQHALDRFRGSIGADRLDQALAANGVTTDDVRELIRQSLVQNEVAKAVTAQRLTDQRLRDRYRSSIADYTTLHVDHIVVKSRAEADKVYRKVTAPGFSLRDFQALAKNVSTDPNASNDGGELTQAASQLAPDFAAAAEQLHPGEISKPVQTQVGWQVIWMIDEQVTPFSQARDRILQSASDQEFQGWMRDYASQVTVDPSFGRYDVQQLIVVRITSTDPSATESTPTPSEPVNATPPA
jgi:parvulin-like peptidyl-prolyl isomerase